VLDRQGLISAIEWEARAFERRTGIRTITESTLDQEVLDSGRATAVFRIFQEALANIASHAQATRATVKLAQEHQRLMLTVGDNGKGVPAEALVSSTSLGLIGMRERAGLLGGTVDVRPEHPRGTRVMVSIPLVDRRAASRDDSA
jgi:signal transduction histidine kinase